MNIEILFIIIITSAIQSIFGTGVLLFGTPLLLLFGYEFQFSLQILLPTSILINIFQLKNKLKNVDIFFYKKLVIYSLPPIVLFLYFISKQAININQIVSKFIFPLIVKPNQAGSSNGISMVNKKEELLESINNALLHDDKVIIEEYIKGIEVSCGAFKNKDEIIILPITEIISENDFFDYDAKYNNKSKEITPARISKKETEIIQRNTKEIYSKFNLKGLCRIDYIIKEKQPYIIEINTIPGLSEKSIIPQQLKEAGYNLTEVFTICLEN